MMPTNLLEDVTTLYPQEGSKNILLGIWRSLSVGEPRGSHFGEGGVARPTVKCKHRIEDYYYTVNRCTTVAGNDRATFSDNVSPPESSAAGPLPEIGLPVLKGNNHVKGFFLSVIRLV